MSVNSNETHPNDFELLKTLEFVAFKYPAENKDVFFKAYVARKKKYVK
jgi:hypothetical protein